MGNLGFQELLVIFLVAFLLIGPKRLPQLAKAFGDAIRAFQDALKGDTSDDADDRKRQHPG